tara:strand:- start:1055 stop:1498 length:444 start_codon:yes stop_codon:yes gene_type:complete
MKTKKHKQQRIEVAIERETKKAKLVRRGDRHAWVQNWWLREDNTMTLETFDKHAVEIEPTTRHTETYPSSFFRFNTNAIVRETERAIALHAFLTCPHTHKTIRKLAWFPRSQIINNQLPGWLISAKRDEMRDQHAQGRSVDVEFDGV